MKKILSIALAAFLTMGMYSCNGKGGSQPAGGNVDAKLTDSISAMFGEYFGSAMGGQYKAQDSTANPEKILKGIEYALKADTTDHSFMAGVGMGMQIQQLMQGIKQQYNVNIDEKAFMAEFKKALAKDSVDQMALQGIQTKLQGMLDRAKLQALETDPVAIANKKIGAEFLVKKAKESGYIKDKSGIVYKVLTPGSGANFTEKDVVMTKYVGKLIDGKEFDSSKGQEVPFNMAQVVPGFREMLKLMKPGMKVQVIIPYTLAYGDAGNPPVIGPRETLVFELETTGVQKVDNKAGAQLPVQAAPVH